MDNKVSKMIAWAKNQIGTKEIPANSNNVIYNTHYYGRPVSGSGYSWCVTFIWDGMRLNNLSKYFYGGEKCASCTSLVNFYKKNHPDLVITKDFQVGDFLLYNFSGTKTTQHIGLCTEVLSNTVKSIEGNTGSGNDANGGSVMERTRNKNLIICGIRWWKMGVTEKKGSEIKVELELLKNGSKGILVKSLQILLNGYGCDCGMADSIFGSKTAFAVKDFQKKNKLAVDGIVGQATWNKLLKGD